jgi:hypothetical protein
LIAGHAVGAFPDLAEAAARATIPDGDPVAPDSETHARYQPLVDQYMRWQETFSRAFAGLPASE